jgi:YfiH family protein
VGLDPSTSYDAWQVHSATVVRVDAPRAKDPLRQADILISNTPGVSLFMRFADCVPIFLFDPEHRAIGLVHAGWLGTVRKAVQQAVVAMGDSFDTSAGSLLAAIGPSIGPDHYPVRDDVVREVRRAFGDSAGRYFTPVDGAMRFDLWAANEDLMREVGVRSIENPRLCTACDPESWYSHRGEGGKTGRFGALMSLDTANG